MIPSKVDKFQAPMLNRFVTFIPMRSSVDEAEKVWMSELPAIIGSPVQGGKSASNVERSTRSYSVRCLKEKIIQT